MVYRTRLRSSTMDRSSRAAQGSPTVIRTARMSAPESFSFTAEGSYASRPLRSVNEHDAMRPLSGYSPSPPDDDDVGAFMAAAHARNLAAATASSPAAAAAAASRRSTRKRKAPELLEPSPDRAPRKRKPTTSEAAAAKKPPAKKKRAPGRLKTDPDEEEEEAPCTDSNCCICMTEPEPEERASINGCEHSFCFGCIEKWADRENTCPLCKKRFVKIERVHKPKRQKGVRTPKSTVKVKNKSQRSELTSSLALEGLFGELGRNGIAFESFFGMY